MSSGFPAAVNMCVKRALADCVVLSLQDSSVFYPSCKGCLSRIEVDQQDGTRCRCCKCGYSCSKELVDYRYRLSLRVTRDGCIFRITVFGTCLNPYFGVHASGLKRLVENLDGPVGASTRSTLLLKAVEDCFIGRHFIFGIKLTDTGTLPWVRGPVINGSGSSEKIEVVASQMILPKATVLGGCTVVSYYQSLLQKAAEYELGCAEASKSCTPQLIAPLPIPHRSPAGSFGQDASGFGSLSLQRSKHQDSTLSPTPPFQQSLGLVTSSAEQEGCSNHESEDEDSRHTDTFSTPQPAHSLGPENLRDIDDSALELLPSVSPPAANYPSLIIGRPVGNHSVVNSCLSFPPAGHISKGLSTEQLNETPLPNSTAWEDFPFSESLSEFLSEENKDFDVLSTTERHGNVRDPVETPKNNLKVMSRERNLSSKSTLLSQRTRRITDRHSQTLLNITNTPAMTVGDHRQLSDHVCKNPVGSVNTRPGKNLTYDENNQDKGKTESEKEELLDGDAYNFSADLFSSSLVSDVITNTHTETIERTFPVRSEPGQKSPNNKMVGDHLIPAHTQDLDFVPPSQSTPIGRTASGSDLSYRCSRFSCIFTPKRSFRKRGRHKNHQLVQQHSGIQIDSPRTGSTGQQRDPGGFDVTVRDSQEIIVPPTPAAKTKRRTGTQINSSSVSLGLTSGKHRVLWKRVTLNQTLLASRSQTGNGETEAVSTGSQEESMCHLLDDKSHLCNLSRDLFSDSV